MEGFKKGKEGDLDTPCIWLILENRSLLFRYLSEN